MPPIAAVTGGIVVVALCFLLRIPIFIVGVISIILLLYTLTIHGSIFGLEYKTMSAPEFLKQNASIFIVVAIILVALGYILYLFGPKGAVQNAPLSNPLSQYVESREPREAERPRNSERYNKKSNWFGSRNSSYNRDRERREIENELIKRA